MKPFIYAYLSAYIFMCCGIIQIETKCLHPDVPENGNYTEHSNTLQSGDKITYSCRKGFALSGMERRVCKTSGHWSDHVPFCDPAANLTNPTIIDSRMDSNFLSGSSLIDGKTDTCVEWELSKNDYIKVSLSEKLIIRTVRIFLKKGTISIQIFTRSDKNMVSKSNYTSYLESDRWVVFECEGNLFSDLVRIEITDRNRLGVCEIEVYGKTEKGCDQSPSREILNGHLEVSRTKAVLICDDDYKIEGSSRLVCEENTWIGGPLMCEERLCDPDQNITIPTGGDWTFLEPVKKITAGTRRKLKCSANYKIAGTPEVIECLKDGTWTKTNATCVERLCDPDQNITKQTGGDWTFLEPVKKISVGTRRKLKCSANYKIAGTPEVIECLEDETWTKTNATCIERLCDPDQNITIPTGGDWTFLEPVSENISVGTRRKLKCSANYKIAGTPEVIECLNDGTWTKTNATCVERLCDPDQNITIPTGGDWTFLEPVKKITAGTRRKLKCSANYKITGNPEVIECLKDGTWTKTNATCVEIEKPKVDTQTTVYICVGVAVILIITALLGAISFYYYKATRLFKI